MSGAGGLLDPVVMEARAGGQPPPGRALLAREPFTGGWEAVRWWREEALPRLLQLEGVEEIPTPFPMPQVRVPAARLLEVCRHLKDEGFNVLIDVGGVDYLPRQPRFEVVYHLLALPALWRLRLRVPVPEEDPRVPSVARLWPAAAAAEREVYDLFGIVFEGHPNLKRILMPEDWQGHPLRKDYPLRGPRDLDSGKYPGELGRFFKPRLPGGLRPGPQAGTGTAEEGDRGQPTH